MNTIYKYLLVLCICSFEKIDVCSDGKIYCKFRIPPQTSSKLAEVGALVKDGQQRVFLAAPLHVFTYSGSYIGLVCDSKYFWTKYFFFTGLRI